MIVAGPAILTHGGLAPALRTLANAVRHASASSVSIDVARNGGTLQVRVRDDGIGGADPDRGSGLTGLSDRVEALGGSIAVESPQGRGTSLEVMLPVAPGG